MIQSDNSSDARGNPLAPHGVLTEFYASPTDRTGFVRNLFDNSARHYDGVSGLLSFGTDRQYRKHALRKAGLAPGMKVLDVATGTGLVAEAALDLGIQPGEITGLDPSLGMLSENRKRRAIPLVQGFGERLPFASGAFDFIVMGYALRHVADLAALFKEFHRVLRPRGRVLVLEITRPKSRVAFRLMAFYMHRIVPLLTRLFTRNQHAGRLMEYYWVTIAECVPPEAILTALRSSGLGKVERKTTGSIFSEYVAAKES